MKKILLTLMVFGIVGCSSSEVIVLECNNKTDKYDSSMDWVIELNTSLKTYREFWSHLDEQYLDGFREGKGIFEESVSEFTFNMGGTGKCNVWMNRETGVMYFCRFAAEDSKFQCKLSDTSYSAHRKKAIQFHDSIAKEQEKKNKF
jgi:hypothetical protein